MSVQQSVLHLRDRLNRTPLAALGQKSTTILSEFLNPKKVTLKNNNIPDWRGFAQCCGYSTRDVENFELKSDPTLEVIKKIFKANKDLFVGAIIDHLQTLQRWDIIEEEEFYASLESDISSYELEKNCENRVSEDDDDLDVGPNLFPLTRGDALGIPELFDAFVCSTYSDFPFVQKILHVLEDSAHFKLCIIGRDLLGGSAESEAIAEIIANRCRAVIIVISREFLKSEECAFQINFAHNLSPAGWTKPLIPVLIDKIDKNKIPRVLQPTIVLDYKRDDIRPWFWEKLANSIRQQRMSRLKLKSPIDHRVLNIHTLTEEELAVRPDIPLEERLPDSKYEPQKKKVPVIDMQKNAPQKQVTSSIVPKKKSVIFRLKSLFASKKNDEDNSVV